MTKVLDEPRAPLLGPVIGHTTANSSRIWIRADSDLPDDYVGLYTLRIGASGSSTFPEVCGTFALKNKWSVPMTEATMPLLDTIGLLDLADLLPGVRYILHIATGLQSEWANFRAARDDRNIDLIERIRLVEHYGSPCSFATFAGLGTPRYAREVKFLLGSCHYPGHAFQKARSVNAFKPVVEAVLKSQPDCMLMVGDQIYSDAFADAAYQSDHAERYRERYTESWSGRWKQQAMSTLPTYMILDDHEIEDNWDSRRIGIPGKDEVFEKGIQSYVTYQWIHGPRSVSAFRNVGRSLIPSFYYEFEVNGFAFFVMDVRSERVPDPANCLLSEMTSSVQLDALRNWLLRNSGNRPKFIISSVVFAPDAKMTGAQDKDDDGWSAYPKTRAEVLAAIFNDGKPISNVIFLSGDAHCSSLARITISAPGHAHGYAYSVTSSPFFAPFSIARRSAASYIGDSILEHDTFDGRVLGYSFTMDSRLMETVEVDNFSGIHVTWDNDTATWRMTLVRYSGDGESKSIDVMLTN